jgi:biotin synthase
MNYMSLARKVIKGKALSLSEASALIQTDNGEVINFFSAANWIRKAFKGNRVKLCAIVNAKSGRCSENCAFCAQSAHFKTKVPTYPLLPEEQIVAAARAAERNMAATCFSVVTSGKSVNSAAEIATVGSALKTIARETGLNRCVSMGTLGSAEIGQLKKAGLKRLHHNLETAESYFNNLCTTHSYQERLNTIKLAKQAGMEVCSGGIFGLGETPRQRVELAFALRELEVESVPINILNPIPGTPAVKSSQPMTPLEVLKLVATYRFILPKADIGVFGGRERALRDLQPLLFIAGANVTLIGDYLTTKGQAPEKDLQMIKDLGLEIDR